MKSTLVRAKKLAWLLTVAALSMAVRSAYAQAPEPVHLYAPDTSQFPVLSLYLDVRDASGNVLHGLLPNDVTLIEDEQFVPVQEIKEEQPGIEIAVAINASPSMGIRNAEGRVRFDAIAETLAAWAGQSAESPDTYSLFTNGGKTVTTTSITEWLNAFQAYKADFRNATPSFGSLETAIRALENAPAKPGRNRAILWITSPPEGKLLERLPEISDQVQKAGIRLFTWSVSPAAAMAGAENEALRQITDASGGQFFPFSGNEALPDPNGYFAPYRGVYRLSYHSTLHEGGEHNLSVQIQQPDGTLASQPVQFRVDIQPPNPMLVSPPTHITRTSPEDSLDPLQDLSPKRQVVRALVEFPDQHPRSLVATRLYVDGSLVAENTQAPFDTFNWDINTYMENGVHRLKVEAEDSLGLSKQSLEIPVEVAVIVPPATLKTTLARNRQYLPWGAAGLASLVLIVVVYTSSRHHLLQRIRVKVTALRKGSPHRSMTSEMNDLEPGGKTLLENSGHLHKRKLLPAELVWLSEEGSPLTKTPVKVGQQDILFGREPNRVSCLLSHPSVEGVHARISHDAEGRLVIKDLGSVAGTWVNYAPVSPDGAHLEHGDIIHIGRVALRVVITSQPNRPPKIENLSENA